MGAYISTVQDEGELAEIYEAVEGGFMAQFKCGANAAPYPDFEWMLTHMRSFLYLVARDEDTEEPLLLALVDQDGRVAWLCFVTVNLDTTHIVRQLGFIIRHLYGQAYGRVENDALRHLIAQSGGHRIEGQTVWLED